MYSSMWAFSWHFASFNEAGKNMHGFLSRLESVYINGSVCRLASKRPIIEVKIRSMLESQLMPWSTHSNDGIQIPYTFRAHT